MDIVVQAIEESSAQRNAPARVSIEETLRRLNERSRANPGQGVVLPPRITRKVSVQSGAQTSVVMLVRVPPVEGRTEQQRVAEVVAAVRDALDDLATPGVLFGENPSNWTSVTGALHDPRRNGPVEFWTSGQAAVTRTRESASPLSLEYAENPIGPNDPALTDRTADGEIGRVLSGERRSFENARDLLLSLALVTVPLAVAWGASSVRDIYLARRASAPSPAPRANPHRARRR